jgi:2'-5' RNA ligase
MNHPPLIITLRLLPEQQQFFNELRKTHFPAHANYLDAHITLFHHLPSDGPFIHEQLKEFARHPNIKLLINKICYLGNGVAYSIESAALQQLHQKMQHTFMPWLNTKDQQPLWPHITIQNKATAFKAQQLFEKLKTDFTPFEITATGINTWLYLKGPWKAVETLPFMDAHL